MASDRAALHTGGCQCGAIRYALYATPEGVHLCHCRMCQRAVGNAFAAWAPVRMADLAWVRGEPAIYQSSNIVARGFCRDCGTPLTFGYIGSDWIDVSIGSLDDPAAVPPDRHLSVESMVPWLQFADDWPRTRTEDTMDAAHQAAMVSYQATTGTPDDSA